MKSRNTLFSLVLLLAACSGAAAPDEMMEKPEEAMMEDKPEDAMAEPTHDAMMGDAIPISDEMTDETADMMEGPA